MIYRFGDCELDTARAELRRAGEPVEIQPKPLALLALLIAARERVVAKQELLGELWPDTAVTESSLAKAVSLARSAIGDDGRRSWIRSVARRGYRFAGDVLEVESAEPPARAEDEAFVGRDAALASLRDAWLRAGAGRGQIVLVSGVAGIGKSRLAHVFAAECRAKGALVLAARADASEGAPSFWIWVQLLRALAGIERDPEADALLRRLSQHDDASDPAASGPASRFRVFDDVTQLLRKTAAARPVLVVLDDLQWLPRASLSLLEHLAHELAAQRVLLVGTIRDEHREYGHPLNRTLSLLGQLPHVTPLELDGLARADVGAWLAGAIGHTPPQPLVDELMARTEGNPLFLREALRLLHGSGKLAFPEATVDWGLERLPERMLDVVRRRCDGLPAECIELVEAASVVGREFSLPVVARIADVARDCALDRLDAAVRAGVVEETSQPGGYRFAHPLFQEVAYAGIAPGRRARLHRRAADALEALGAELADEELEAVAHHLHRALSAADPERAFERAHAAAERARRLLAWEQAATHYEQALDALAHQERPDPLRRLDTLLALGRAHRVAGDRARRREVLGRALEAARSLGDPARFADAAIDFCDMSEWSPRDATGETILAEALEWIGPRTSVVRARLLTRSAYLATSRDRAAAEPLARRAVAAAREVGDPQALQEALYALHLVLSRAESIPERRALVAEMHEAARGSDAPDLAFIGRLDVASDALVEGDAAAAREQRALALELAGPRPHRGLVWHLSAFDTGVALLEGRFELAEQKIRDTFLVGQLIGHPYAPPLFLGQTLYLLRDCGRLDELARNLAPRGAPRSGEVRVSPFAAATSAAMYAQVGRMDEARRVVANFGPDLRTLVGRHDWTAAAAELATALVALRDEKRAAQLYEALEPVAHLHAVVPIPVLYNGPLARTRGVLAALLGEARAAAAHLEDALERCAPLGARPWDARIRLELGRVLLRIGREKPARALLRQAAERAGALGMQGVAAEATAAER